jgi:hypothetical protein
VINTREDLERITTGAQTRYDETRQPRADVENQLRGGFNLAPKPEPPKEGEQKNEQ